MDWSPGPEMNSVGALQAHMTRVLHEGIDVALNVPSGRVRAQESQTRGVPADKMLRHLDDVIDNARSALSRLSLMDLGPSSIVATIELLAPSCSCYNFNQP
jgi:hypothetical protein